MREWYFKPSLQLSMLPLKSKSHPSFKRHHSNHTINQYKCRRRPLTPSWHRRTEGPWAEGLVYFWVRQSPRRQKRKLPLLNFHQLQHTPTPTNINSRPDKMYSRTLSGQWPGPSKSLYPSKNWSKHYSPIPQIQGNSKGYFNHNWIFCIIPS